MDVTIGREILRQAGIVPDPSARDLDGAVETRQFDSANFCAALKGFRVFLGCGHPGERGETRPSGAFARLVLGYGVEGAETLLDAYARSLVDPAAASREFAAIRAFVQQAHADRRIGWSLATWKPPDDAQVTGKVRAAHYWSPETIEKVRVLSFELRTSASQWIEDACTKELVRIETERGEPIAARPAPKESKPLPPVTGASPFGPGTSIMPSGIALAGAGPFPAPEAK